jgi:hypothetical protein
MYFDVILKFSNLIYLSVTSVKVGQFKNVFVCTASRAFIIKIIAIQLKGNHHSNYGVTCYLSFCIYDPKLLFLRAYFKVFFSGFPKRLQVSLNDHFILRPFRNKLQNRFRSFPGTIFDPQVSKLAKS